MAKLALRQGQRFGRLTVVEEAGRDQHGRTLWLCRCDCGQMAAKKGTYLAAGRTQSCGCLKAAGHRRTHGRHGTRAYTAWCNMGARCRHPGHPQFKDYGGRGISIDPKWNSFQGFYADMGDPPPGSSLDRIDNEKGYGPENCRWTDRTTQRKNSRAVHMVTINGETMHIADAITRYSSVTPASVYGRIGRGWPIAEAVTRPKTTKWSRRREA